MKTCHYFLFHSDGNSAYVRYKQWNSISAKTFFSAYLCFIHTFKTQETFKLLTRPLNFVNQMNLELNAENKKLSIQNTYWNFVIANLNICLTEKECLLMNSCGRKWFDQPIPRKMRGIKSFELCGHFTGYLSKCIVSCGVRISLKSDMTPANIWKNSASLDTEQNVPKKSEKEQHA